MHIFIPSCKAAGALVSDPLREHTAEWFKKKCAALPVGLIWPWRHWGLIQSRTFRQRRQRGRLCHLSSSPAGWPCPPGPPSCCLRDDAQRKLTGMSLRRWMGFGFFFSTVQNHTREGIHAGGVVDGQHSNARLLFEEINGAPREGLQLLSDLLLIEAVDAGAAAPSLQQPWRHITHFLLLKLNWMLLKLQWNIHWNNNFNPARPVSSDERGILVFRFHQLASGDCVALLLFSFKWHVENCRMMNTLGSVPHGCFTHEFQAPQLLLFFMSCTLAAHSAILQRHWKISVSS